MLEAMKSSNKKVVDIKYAKSNEYKRVIKTIADSEKCPFCKENFKYHKNPILKTHKSWFITENSWPYKNTKHHFIIICEDHKEKLEDLTASDFSSTHELMKWAIKKYNLKGGGLTLRFGETTWTGATVCHLHFHLIIPEIDQNTKRAKTVQFPIG
jgi:ATP adenylyltransferase